MSTTNSANVSLTTYCFRLDWRRSEKNLSPTLTVATMLSSAALNRGFVRDDAGDVMEIDF
jgi:hypothetical protein